MIHSYPWYISDWRESETRLAMTAEQRGVYREALDYCYREGSLPSDRDTLIKVLGITSREFDRTWNVVQGQFYQQDGRFRNNRVDGVLSDLAVYHEQKKQASARGVAARRSKNRVVDHVVNRVVDRTVNPSTSTSTSTSTSPLNPQPLDDHFEEIWQAYPARGRTRRPMCEQYYAQVMMTAQDIGALHREILEPLLPGGKWERSKTWGNGYVFSLADYLANKRWQESPEPKGEWD